MILSILARLAGFGVLKILSPFQSSKISALASSANRAPKPLMYDPAVSNALTTPARSAAVKCSGIARGLGVSGELKGLGSR
jgi:hypothetical protein